MISQGIPRKKKSDSMGHFLKDKNKININISQNININTNIKEIRQNQNEQKIINLENKSKNNNPKKNDMKMKSCIYNLNNSKNNRNSNSKLFLSGHISFDKSHSKEYNSSIKIDKLSIKQSKSTKESRESQFFEFYINDKIKNLEYRLKNNSISTSKYNFFTFISKGLLYQFSRLSNIYFLFTAIIQSIPVISPNIINYNNSFNFCFRSKHDKRSNRRFIKT